MEERPKCPYCKTEHIEFVRDTEILICYECHKWFYDEDLKEN
jgi:uncharacterized protein YbaR (Trm112 family)